MNIARLFAILFARIVPYYKICRINRQHSLCLFLLAWKVVITAANVTVLASRLIVCDEN